MSSVLLADRAEVKLDRYAVAGPTSLTDPTLLPLVQEHRRRLGSLMRPMTREDFRKKAPTADYHVSRKIDGEFTVLIYRDGQLFTMNPGGVVRIGMPWQEEAAMLLKQGNVTEALFAGELYTEVKDRRGRVHDLLTVVRQPKTNADLNRLRFAAFDLLSLNGQAPASFADAWGTIEKLLGAGKHVHPVESRHARTAAEIDRIFEDWVVGEGAEGLVVRSDTAGMYKIKPKHTLDAVVIGYAESSGDREGLLHDLLLGLVRDDGTIQVLTRVGGGFTLDDRRDILADLKDLAVDSDFIESNSDHVAYQMVRPEWVIEISCLDMVAETTRGGTIPRMVLEFAGRYRVVRPLPLVSVISPQFVRRREDKTPRPEDAGLSQVTRIVEVPLAQRSARQLTLPTSEVILREVYTKAAKGETMVRKFVAWKTNKEQESDEYSAYVLHFTDFSPNRKDPLSREVRVSSSREQIVRLFEAMRDENVKKGWELAAHFAAPVAAQATAVAPVAAPIPTPAAEEIAPPVAAEEKKPLAPSEPVRKKSTRKKKSG